MRLLLTGDWHLGKIINQTSLLEEQRHALKQIETIITEQHVDCLVITGDIYDRAIPPKEAIELFDSFISDVIQKNMTNVVLIAGNHDSQERLAFGRRIMQSGGLYIADKFRGVVPCVTLNDDQGPLHLYLIPFAPYQEIRGLLEDDTIHNFQTAYQKMLATIRLDESARNVLVTHAFVTAFGQTADTSDSEKTLAVGGIEVVDAALFSAFDYVALGHLHKPHAVGVDSVRYTGSLCKYSFSEALHQKSVILLELKDKGQLNQTQIPLRQQRDFVVLTDAFATLLTDEKRIKAHHDDYVKIVLTDKTEVSEPVPRLRQVFPNIMEFTYAETVSTYLEESMMSACLADKLSAGTERDFTALAAEMFADFAEKTAAYTLTEKARLIFEAALLDVLEGNDVT